MRILEAINLSKHYGEGVAALDGVSFAIEQGEWVSMMGPSGSGKTTLLNLIGCLDVPTAGQLLVAGKDIQELNESERAAFRREHIGLIFQQFHLIPYLTVLENVMLAQYFHSVVDEEQARSALDYVGLGHRLRHLPSQLSGGEQQRVCIARALINEPQLILADEPTGNLDKENEELVLRLFREIRKKGQTLIVVTHDWEVGREADRVLYLDHGRLAPEPVGAGAARV